MINRDIYVSDSGRPIHQTGFVVYITSVGSGTIIRKPTTNPSGGVDLREYDAVYPSGSYGVTTTSIYAGRFDDYSYYTTNRSGYMLGVPSDIRQGLL